MMRLGALALLLSLVSACVATPIPLPGTDDLWISAARDAGAADIRPPNGKHDQGWKHADAAVSGDDGALDSACLECPLPDGMTDGGASDAEAGTSTDALAADALTDLQTSGDLTMGE